MTIEEFVCRAIRVPFKEKGRDFDGWDCWGCFRKAYLEIYNIELPEYLDYSSSRAYGELHKLIEGNMGDWVEVDKPCAGDGVLFTISGSPCHVAFAIDSKNALHAEERLGTFIEPIFGTVWGKRYMGAFKCLNKK